MPQRIAMEIINDWRAVERDLEAAPPGSPEAAHLDAEAGRLRREYQRLVAEVGQDDLPWLDQMPTRSVADGR